MDAAHDQVETAAARRRRSVVGSRVLIIATIAVVGMSGCAGAETAATTPSPAASAASMAPASAAPRVSAAPATPSPTTGEPELDALVDVGAGRKIHVRCTGAGSPTVILEGGDEDTLASYGYAVPALAEVTRTCRYDRANLGGSDPAPGPRGLPELVADLEQMIAAAEIPGPYVLVGTSGGGYITAGYAFAHPEQVTGMVFVDVGSPFLDPPAQLVEDTRWDSPVNIEKRDYLQVEKDAWAARKQVGDIPVTVITNEYSAERDRRRRSSPPSAPGWGRTSRTKRAGSSSAREPGRWWSTPAMPSRRPTQARDGRDHRGRRGGPRGGAIPAEPRTAVTIAGIRTGRRPRHP